MESLIERSAIGESTGLALEIGVPLALGILFQQLHRQVEALVDRVFLHREHRARGRGIRPRLGCYRCRVV